MDETKVSTYLQNNYDDYYHNGASKWRWLGAKDKAKNIFNLCKGLPIDSVVEIGAGEGSILQRLSDLGFAQELVALEISQTGVTTINNKKIPRLKECLLFNGYNTPYDNRRFDLAILSHVVEHVEFPRKLIYEAKRIAKYVFIEVPLEDIIRLPQDFHFDKIGHINFYSPKTFRRLIQTCNLKVLAQHTSNPSKEIYTFQKGNKGLINFYIKEYLLKFFPLLATAIFSYHSSILCESSENLLTL